MSNKSIYAFSVLLFLVIIGMLTGLFQLIIYPYLLIVGLLLLSSLAKKVNITKKLVWIPSIVTIIFLILQIGLEMTLKSPTGSRQLVFGLVPSTAIYYFGIWIVCLSISLIYSWTFNYPDTKQSFTEEKTIKISPEIGGGKV